MRRALLWKKDKNLVLFTEYCLSICVSKIYKETR